MELIYPKYQFTTKDNEEKLVRFVPLNNPDSYPFDEFHSHEYNEIMVFTKGGGRHNINFIEHAIQNNSIHFLASGDVHCLERSMLSEGFAIVYKDAFLVRLKELNPTLAYFEFFNSSRVCNLTKKDCQSFSNILTTLRSNKGNDPYLLNLIAAFLTKTVQSFYHPEEEPAARTDYSIVVKLISLVNLHYREHLSAIEYARRLHCSVSVLERKVKRMTSKTIAALQQEKLLNEARRGLLKKADCSKETAFELGFSSEAYFSKWFKKLVGCTPSAFKKGLLPVVGFLLFLLGDLSPERFCV